MIFKQTSRETAEKVFINVYNLTGAAVSAGIPVQWDVATLTDGVAVTACKADGAAGLFVGITNAAIANSAYGLVQVYGYRTSAYLVASTANSVGGAAGDFCKTGTGGLVMPATQSAAAASGHCWITLMETFTATAGASTSVAQLRTFIRAL